MGIGYEQAQYRFFADARYGFFGHEAFVGQIGADIIARPVDGLTVTFPPYAVAPYAAGPQEVLIPYSELRGILNAALFGP